MHAHFRSLHKVIQDLRRQYSGCIPITRQENLSKLLRDMNEDKRRLTQELKGILLSSIVTYTKKYKHNDTIWLIHLSLTLFCIHVY